jgi:hypothetical protein
MRSATTGRFVKVGNVAVDSGQIMLIDPCYIKADFETEYNAPPALNYAGACKASLSSDGYGEFGGLGFCTSSGYGDGLYPVYVKRDETGRVAEIKIKFIER